MPTIQVYVPSTLLSPCSKYIIDVSIKVLIENPAVPASLNEADSIPSTRSPSPSTTSLNDGASTLSHATTNGHTSPNSHPSGAPQVDSPIATANIPHSTTSQSPSTSASASSNASSNPSLSTSPSDLDSRMVVFTHHHRVESAPAGGPPPPPYSGSE